MSRIRLGLAASVAIIAVSTLAITSAPAAPAKPSCPPGFLTMGQEREAHLSISSTLQRAIDGVPSNMCVLARHPESARAFDLANAAYGPHTPQEAGLLAQALKQQASMAPSSSVKGAVGKWTPYGSGPQHGDDPNYQISAEGINTMEGRIDSLAYDAQHNRVFATLGTGGVFMTSDLGRSWHSIGDSLPTQINGAIGYSKAEHGTLIDVTGEPIMAYGARVGLGAYRSTNLGKTWEKVKGIPDGALGFQVAVDPTHDKVIYVATSKGLYRSGDDGVSFRNVNLPTGTNAECAGKTDNQKCLLANMVTDVIVQAADKFGHQGGRVLAVVGYRAGARPFPQDNSIIESPTNGLYRSDTGLPNTFTWLQNPSGFAPQNRIGNTKLGATIGPDQDHGYVYAIVQDAGQFKGDPPLVDLPAAISSQTGPLPSESVLLGVYVSSNFGDTWTQMANHQEIADNPTTGSALAGTGQAQLYAPGVQAWYNEWIHPDPTRQDTNGVPERLTFGLEEVWQNTLTTAAQNGHSNFKVIGKYFSGKTCLFTFLPTNVCPTSTSPQQQSTTHPDQHAGLYVPDGNGGVTLIVGNDGGAYAQHADGGAEFSNESWGSGINEGFNTLLPYHARMAKDGVVWYGLQDNGSGKVQDGHYVETFGGDGTFVAVDPNNSDYAWVATPVGAMATTTDGGKSWSPQPAPITNAQFVNPYVMDPFDSNHVITAGTEVVETTMGPKTCTTVTDPTGNNSVTPSQACNWTTVYNLGTLKHPGDSSVPGSPTQGSDDPSNQQSAMDLRGSNAYVAYCGPCDIMNSPVGFHNGIATNVDGSLPAQKGTADGWHIASAHGLANRLITGVAIDPSNPETVYVTVGGYQRGWRAPGSFGDHNRKALVREGNVYRSTDAGATFHSVSAGLPLAPANSIVVRGSQLIVGTDIGVFISSDKSGSEWAPLGKGLPHVPVSSLQIHPGNANVLMASTYGRSIWIYHFSGASHRAGVAWPRGASPLAATLAVLLVAVLLARKRTGAPMPA